MDSNGKAINDSFWGLLPHSFRNEYSKSPHIRTYFSDG